MAAAVFKATGAPNYALSFTGIETRVIGERRTKLGPALLTEAQRFSSKRSSGWRAGHDKTRFPKTHNIITPLMRRWFLIPAIRRLEIIDATGKQASVIGRSLLAVQSIS